MTLLKKYLKVGGIINRRNDRPSGKAAQYQNDFQRREIIRRKAIKDSSHETNIAALTVKMFWIKHSMYFYIFNLK